MKYTFTSFFRILVYIINNSRTIISLSSCIYLYRQIQNSFWDKKNSTRKYCGQPDGTLANKNHKVAAVAAVFFYSWRSRLKRETFCWKKAAILWFLLVFEIFNFSEQHLNGEGFFHRNFRGRFFRKFILNFDEVLLLRYLSYSLETLHEYSLVQYKTLKVEVFWISKYNAFYGHLNIRNTLKKGFWPFGA